MDLITKLLAQLLDSFKVKNPKLFAIITLVMMTLQFVLMQGVDSDIFGLTPTINYILQGVNFVLAVLMNSATYAFRGK